ncbi:MAG: hypothetical protein M3P00_07860 [Gemmatimonadota bacterium]|nr:hypothetical protein [Gemmatimonadota bacterium]
MSHLSEEQLDQIIAEEKARPQPPLNDWQTIATRARDEGLIREPPSRSWASSQSWVQAAAAVLLLIGGIAIGRTTIGLPSATQNTASLPSENAVPSSVPVVDAAQPSSASATFASLEEASATLDRAVEDYKRATEFLAANNSSGRPSDSAAMYSKRLVALDQVFNATESALQTAPHDPVINQYYLATMGARAATRQMVARPVILRGF